MLHVQNVDCLDWSLFVKVEEWLPELLADVLVLGIGGIAAGQRTLGAEYASLLPVDTTKRVSLLQLPYKRLFIVIGMLKISRLLTVSAINSVFKVDRSCLNDLFDGFNLLHLAVFYWNGRHPTLFHRLLSIRYIYYPRRAPIMASADQRIYRGLALLSGVTGALKISNAIIKLWPKRMAKGGTAAADAESLVKCPVCVDSIRKPIASSVCGHVYCWECLVEWLKSSSSGVSCCPVCRKEVQPVDLIPLINL